MPLLFPEVLCYKYGCNYAQLCAAIEVVHATHPSMVLTKAPRRVALGGFRHVPFESSIRPLVTHWNFARGRSSSPQRSKHSILVLFYFRLLRLRSQPNARSRRWRA